MALEIQEWNGSAWLTVKSYGSGPEADAKFLKARKEAERRSTERSSKTRVVRITDLGTFENGVRGLPERVRFSVDLRAHLTVWNKDPSGLSLESILKLSAPGRENWGVRVLESDLKATEALVGDGTYAVEVSGTVLVEAEDTEDVDGDIMFPVCEAFDPGRVNINVQIARADFTGTAVRRILVGG